MRIRQSSGWSLTELLIVMVVIGILAAIAIPAYQSVVVSSRETEAKNALYIIYMGEKIYRLNSADKTYWSPGHANTMSSADIQNMNNALNIELPIPQYYNLSITITGQPTEANYDFTIKADEINGSGEFRISKNGQIQTGSST